MEADGKAIDTIFKKMPVRVTVVFPTEVVTRCTFAVHTRQVVCKTKKGDDRASWMVWMKLAVKLYGKILGGITDTTAMIWRRLGS